MIWDFQKTIFKILGRFSIRWNSNGKDGNHQRSCQGGSKTGKCYSIHIKNRKFFQLRYNKLLLHMAYNPFFCFSASVLTAVKTFITALLQNFWKVLLLVEHGAALMSFTGNDFALHWKMYKHSITRICVNNDLRIRNTLFYHKSDDDLYF